MRLNTRAVDTGDASEKFRDCSNKALQVNLDPKFYGSFAEIGAGQEVARWFFAVGGAAGTIAKSISAYDMTISDTFYGKCERYVTKERLEAMLEYEYLQCALPLKKDRGQSTCFFAFADTVVAKAYMRNNECHGWLGIKWQTAPGAAPARLMLHIRMLDETATVQQEALGVFGVNFTHAALYLSSELNETQDYTPFLKALMNELSSDRIEVDAIELDGPGFENVDNRVLALNLVEQGLTDAVYFGSNGEICIPSDKIRKKNILLQRGSFRPFTNLNNDMIDCAASTFLCDQTQDADECIVRDDSIVLLELTLKDLRDTGDGLVWTEDLEASKRRIAQDFLARVDTIGAMGYDCLVSNYFEYFRVASYIRRSTKEAIVITLGVPAVKELFKEQYYKALEGGILENFGRLLQFNMKLYVYPTIDADGTLITASNLQLDPSVQPLYEFMYNNGTIVGVESYDEDFLRTIGNQSPSAIVLEKIKNHDDSWKQLVPASVANVIESHGLYNA